MLGCPKGKRSPRYHRKTRKDRAKKTDEARKTLSSFARGKLQKTGEYWGGQKQSPKTGSFPAKMGGLESLFPEGMAGKGGWEKDAQRKKNSNLKKDYCVLGHTGTYMYTSFRDVDNIRRLG